METWKAAVRRSKKAARTVLRPPMPFMAALLPIATILLIYSLGFLTPRSPISIAAYGISAYTLIIWCVFVGTKIKVAAQAFIASNKYTSLWAQDVSLRENVSLFFSFTWNFAYAAFQLFLGIRSVSVWYYAMTGYYLCLAVMRLYLSRHIRKYHPREKMRGELLRYRTCGIILIAMNLALNVMIFCMIYWDRTFRHSDIITITMATYTFISFASAIANMVKYRRYSSPVLSASKIISMTAACVSMLTLSTTMISTFGGPEDAAFRRVMLASIGFAIWAFVMVMSIYMIVRATRKLKLLAKDSPKEAPR